MALQTFDYILSVNSLCENLFHSHRELLQYKSIGSKRDLIQAIKLDLDKLTHALLEVRETSAISVLTQFFDGTELGAEKIAERLAADRIYHVGFEIHEPLDLILYGINHWIENSRQTLGVEMRIRDYLRFPASAAFQCRVGAYTEIMRIWLDVDGRELMLELFDIQRPCGDSIADAPKLVHRNFNGLFHLDDFLNGHDKRVSDLFASDEIWHYAFSVNNPRDVLELHAEWQELAARHSDFFVPYAEPVDNPHDRSFHTKVIRRSGRAETRKELEFVTHFNR